MTEVGTRALTTAGPLTSEPRSPAQNSGAHDRAHLNQATIDLRPRVLDTRARLREVKNMSTKT